jgi:hypothetical protein
VKHLTRTMSWTGCFLVVACAGSYPNASAWAKGIPALDTLDRMPAQQALPALAQRLLDALPGDSAVWEHYLSDSALYVSESGEVATKKELLDAFRPFPAGFAGSIEVKNSRVMSLGDLAVSVFDAHEKQNVYDQQIEVNYRGTQTWRREHGRWRLIAAQNVVIARDPRPLPIRLEKLADYAGTYELSGKRRYRVALRGDTLLGGREASEMTRLIPVGENVFAESGSTLGVLRVFVRGPSGAVVRMVQRRKFADLDWMKVASEVGRSKE